MRNIVVAALSAGAAALIGALPAQAVGIKHAFCIQGSEEYQGLSNCTFDTYEQCLASASGRNLTCIANPYFAGQSDDPYAYKITTVRSHRTTFPSRRISILAISASSPESFAPTRANVS